MSEFPGCSKECNSTAILVVESCSCVTTSDSSSTADTLSSRSSEFNSLVFTEFHCAICRGLIVAASMANCGHQFCRSCLAQWRLENPNCPVCRCRITVALNCPLIDRFLDNFVENFVGEETIRQVRRQYEGRGWRAVITEDRISRYISTGSHGSTY